jgi:SAM-dependent methyltransferase
MYLSLLVSSMLFLTPVMCDVGHLAQGTHYGEEGARSYAASRHGPDGALFLDPYFIPSLTELKDQTVLDVGCGAGPWSIFAALHGAEVFGIDIQPQMIELAKKAIKEAGVDDRVILDVGDVAELPYESSYFDLGISINVGCNIPSTAVAFDEMAMPHIVGLGPHCMEVSRVLKKDGKFILTAPTSFDIVFTDGTPKEDVLAHIANVLSEIGSEASPKVIVAKLQQLSEVYRATFALREGYVCLVTDESTLKDGEEIWRKIPGLVVPNRYHSEQEYLECFQEAGLELENIFHPCFSSAEEKEAFLKQHPEIALGDEYINHPPFVIFQLRK